MLVSRVLEVRDGDTQRAVRDFLAGLVREGAVGSLFLAAPSRGGMSPRGEVYRNAESLEQAELLAPVMVDNAALALQRITDAHPEMRLAALLRPCEVRAAIEMAKRRLINLGRLTLIGMDCIATYPAEDYLQTEKGTGLDKQTLLREALGLASKGETLPSHYRLSCRMCDRPAPDYQAVDITLGLIGVDNSRFILVQADENVDEGLKLVRVTDRVASERDAVDREVSLWRVGDKRRQAADHILHQLGLAGASLSVIAACFAPCTLCGECLDSCPLAPDDLRLALKQGKEAFLTAWAHGSQRMASCCSCGMCQAHCPEGIPLGAISRALGRQVQGQMHYVPGRDVAEPLPWIC